MKRRPLHLALFSFAAPLAALAVGCTAPVGPESDAGSTAQKVSVVEVRAWHAPADGSLVRLDAAARFVSVREPGAPADALELLGLGWPNVPSGSCSLVSTEAAPGAAPVRVDLRDLSPVRLMLDARETIVLEPRAFPDVAGLVSGVVFVAPADMVAPPAARSIALQIGSPGPSGQGLALAPIAGLELPELPSPFRLIDAVASVGADGTTPSFTVQAGGLDITTAAPRDGERITVELMRAGVLRARCGVDAAGKLHLDSTALGGAGDATLVVRAQRRVLRDDPASAVDARLERDVELRIVIR